MPQISFKYDATAPVVHAPSAMKKILKISGRGIVQGRGVMINRQKNTKKIKKSVFLEKIKIINKY